MWPAPFTPGSDWVLAMGGARLLAADRDREWPYDNGDAVLVRKGSWPWLQRGELSEVGEGSVERRMLGGLRRPFGSGGAREDEETLWSRRLGMGDERNSSILSVSGTGSILTVDCFGLAEDVRQASGLRSGALGKPTTSPW